MVVNHFAVFHEIFGRKFELVLLFFFLDLLCSFHDFMIFAVDIGRLQGLLLHGLLLYFLGPFLLFLEDFQLFLGLLFQLL